MENPGKRSNSNYTLLSQFPEEDTPQQQSKFSGGGGGGGGVRGYFHESLSAERNQGKSDRVFDWDGDGRLQQGGRVGNLYPSIGLQRQSSGSSFGEGSLSGEYYVPTLSTTVLNDSEMFGHLHEDGLRSGGGGGGGDLRFKAAEANGSSSSKSWAQQTEECYQLQQALALRLSSRTACADDLSFLDSVMDESGTRCSSAPPEVLSHRFWVNGCLSYSDEVPDGFYTIHGVDPYIWRVCTDVQENGAVPSIESLKNVNPRDDTSVEVVLVDKNSDTGLRELISRVVDLSCSCVSTEEMVDQLAKHVCNHMGGAASIDEDGLASRWKDCYGFLKDCLDSIVLPLGNISVGLCRHRSLLFKVLADAIDLPCRIAKGCKYCRRDGASSCLVRFGPDREYLVDLIGKPGCLYEPDSLYNGPSSISIASPLRFPKFKPVETTENFRSWAKQYFLDCQSIDLIFGDASAGVSVEEKGSIDTLVPKIYENDADMDSLMPILENDDSVSPLPQNFSHLNDQDGEMILSTACNDPSVIMDRDLRIVQGAQLYPNLSSAEIYLDIEGLEIPWDELVLKEKIGAGSFGTVHRADWHGSDVAVKILMEQDFHAVRVNDFLREVALMKRLRHPNIVLFMGAVTQPPHLSIVTEYLSRGSLFRFLHKSGARESLDERRRLSMAYDVANGMNYLHRRNPPIVHRDLKSPNLLVDKKFTVKVCDFGLSRLKANTFLSSKSLAGTPEWMAPEVLRDEPSNEKSDIYSFGVILWELVTMQLPWSTLNPAQVVAAVGFKNKRLEIPSNVNPEVAALIEACWANDARRRPSFSDIMESLKLLIRTTAPPHVHPDLPLLTT